MTMNLKIGGMSCGHCVKAVTEALEGVDGVQKAEVDLQQGTAKVESASELPLERLIAAVREEGFEASAL